MQVRGFADQRLRKPESPLDPSNRRVSMIVQYLDKQEDLSRSEPVIEKKEAKSSETPH
jgi:hypothetical protein